MYRTVESRWGFATYFEKDEYVGRSLHYYGEYNPDETEKILELAKGLCLDIGANIGCIGMALESSGFEVISFEPQPQVFEVLSKNVHGTKYNIALGSERGWAPMPKVHYSTRGNFGGLGIGSKSIYGDYNVPVETLDSFALSGVGFIKIDVEGYELEVLKGGRGLILRDKPVLYIEDDRANKSVALRKYIREELGYWISEHKPPLYREKNHFGLKKNVWKANYASHNLICLPNA